MFMFNSGLTLRRTVVHAEKVFAPGQLGVAISRVRDPADLQSLASQGKRVWPTTVVILISTHARRLQCNKT